MTELAYISETVPCLDNADNNILNNMQNGIEPPGITDETLNGINLDERHSSDQSSESSRPRIEQKRSSSITTIKDFLHTTFDSPELEQMYQNYFSKRRRTSVLFLLAIVIVYNAVLLALTVIEYRHPTTKPTDSIPRICMSVIVIVILTILFIIYFPRLVNLTSYSYLPGLLWIVVFLELLVDLLVSYRKLEHLASYSVGLYIFFIYVTYSMIKFRLYACIIVTSILTLFHAIAVGVLTEKRPENLTLQIVSNLMLFLAAMTIGIINYLVTDINQRRSFLDTREVVELKLQVEKEEKNQSRLLQSVLPPYLAKKIVEDDGIVLEENKAFKKIYIKSFEKCSILFADIVGFTEYSSTVTAEELIIMLNELFANFDKLAKRNYCQRIKILGDCYYCISGLDNTDAPPGDINHAENSVEMGLNVVDHIKKVRERIKVSCLDMRVGIHSGHVLAGILGMKKWQYDVWSNDVTLANKMESGGIPGRVHVSQSTYEYIKDSYTVEDGKGAERSQFIADNNISTYLIKEANSKLVERRRTATLKRNSTLKRKDDFAKKKEITQGSRTGTSPLAKISSAFVRASVRISIDYSTAGDSTAQDEFASIGGPEHTKDSQDGVIANHDESKINNLLQNALDNWNSDLRDKVIFPTLMFKDDKSEEKYREEKKQFCLLSLATLLICCAFCFIVELILKKRGTINYITFAVTFVLLALIWFFTGIGRYAERLPACVAALSRRLHYSYVERTLVITICVLILLGSEVIDIVITKSMTEQNKYNPMFYTYNGVLILLAVCTLIQLPYIARVSLLAITTLTYPILFFLCIRELFDAYDNDTINGGFKNIPTATLLTLQYVFYFVALWFHSHQSEKQARVLMLWKKEASDNKVEIESLKSRNEKLMQNILPEHVIEHFLKVENKDETELYSKSYNGVGVIFASIPNFADFYSEDEINKGGIECMRVLNEIISDFDEVLNQFKLIEKIKTVNSCYMAASGLDYNESNSPDIVKGDTWQHLVDLANFALAMKERLNEINAESFNNFELRVGIAKGPVVAGVIGAKKPHYDIWGNTVNIASRMESTGKSGTIQVLQDTFEILKNRDFEFEERGYVNVKGKGKLLTYILKTKESYDYTRPQRPPKENKENLHVNEI